MAIRFNPYQHRMPSFQRPPPVRYTGPSMGDPIRRALVSPFAVDPRGFKGGLPGGDINWEEIVRGGGRYNPRPIKETLQVIIYYV